MYKKPKQASRPDQHAANGSRASTQSPGIQDQISLDDDPELAHIARFSPPEIEIGPDSQCRAGRDVPPPMIKPVSPEPKPQIEHIAPLGPLADRSDSDAIELEDVAEQSPTAAPKKIKAFDQQIGAGRHEDNWNRTPNVTGTGAIHVKSFHCKLTGDCLEFLDMQINEWLDAHPQYEVKQVTTSIGVWTGKTKEPALIVNVWV